MSSGQRRGRWSGVPVRDRPALRRDDLIAAGIGLLGSPGGPSLTVRAACRAAGLTERYFYESFADLDELLGAVYDRVSAELARTVEGAMAAAGESLPARTRAGMAAVLEFSSSDPRRGRVLFTDARANPVLTARRAATQDLLREAVLELKVAQRQPAIVVLVEVFLPTRVILAQQWLAGRLGDDLDAVVDQALALLTSPGASA